MPRLVRPADHEAIAKVVAAAFGRQNEAELVERLRADGDVLFELVEEMDGEIVGHVLLSRLWADSQLLHAALGPLAVAPDRQAAGVGACLMTQAVETAEEFGAASILILGDPAYYGRFGFTAERAAQVKHPYAGPNLLAREIAPGSLADPLLVAYPKAFG